MGKKDISMGEAVVPSTLTPADIQQKEFRVSRFGGYKMRDVDEFLDQITDSFTTLTAEAERLRAGGAQPVVGEPDLDDVARQADEIIARARAEAARIIAEARAASGSAATVEAGPHDRAAVTAFIERERSFLQSLAGLVQEHAETMKGMARTARRGPAAPVTPGPAEPPAAASAAAPPATSDASDATASRPEPRPSAGEPGGSEPSTPSATSDGDDTVRIEEPATAGATRREREPEGDRSLRELFWGED